MIDVQNLSKRYSATLAVDDISFSVAKGEMLGLLGPNGAGKTTTLRMITGFLPPTSGKVSVCGMDVFQQPYEVKRRIGYLPENPPLYDDMTARECLTFVAEIHGLRGREVAGAVERVAEVCGISHMLKRLTGNLSKGYRQRVGLAQALIHEPEILILDEPTVGLDPGQIIEIRQLIRALGEERTVIVSSHILPEVANLCQRVAIINNGRLLAADSIQALSDRLSGGKRIAVKVARPQLVAPDSLARLPGVVSVAPAGDGFVAELSGDDAREALAAGIVAAGAGLLEMRDARLTLEEIFLAVVSGEGK